MVLWVTEKQLVDWKTPEDQLRERALSGRVFIGNCVVEESVVQQAGVRISAGPRIGSSADATIPWYVLMIAISFSGKPYPKTDLYLTHPLLSIQKSG